VREKLEANEKAFKKHQHDTSMKVIEHQKFQAKDKLFKK
jgi:hypothetical protein